MEYKQTENAASHPTDILDEEMILLNQFEYASTGQRFLNWLIDNLLMNYGVSNISAYVIGLIIGVTHTTFFNDLQTNSLTYFSLAYLIGTLNYSLYYILCEKLFNGYTLGKIITGTRAIREDGSAMTIKDVAVRTLCRLVPFEVFSGFKIRPWHDEWSRTMVVKAR